MVNKLAIRDETEQNEEVVEVDVERREDTNEGVVKGKERKNDEVVLLEGEDEVIAEVEVCEGDKKDKAGRGCCCRGARREIECVRER